MARQFADEEDGLCIVHRRWLQGGEVVPQDRGPGVAAHRIIQPHAGHLFGAEAFLYGSLTTVGSLDRGRNGGSQ